MKKKLLKVLFTLIAAILILLVGGGYYMLNVSLRPANNDGRDLEASYANIQQNYPYLNQWLDSITDIDALKDTLITASDGAKLNALYLPAAEPTSKTAFLIHGYTDSAIRMLMLGYMYNHEMGYNIFLPDLRNAGSSEGDHFQMGWNDRHDVIQWMDIANNIFGDSTQMVIHGISMGAATAMMVAGEEQPDYVKCFIEDSGYTDVWDE